MQAKKKHKTLINLSIKLPLKKTKQRLNKDSFSASFRDTLKSLNENK